MEAIQIPHGLFNGRYKFNIFPRFEPKGPLIMCLLMAEQVCLLFLVTIILTSNVFSSVGPCLRALNALKSVGLCHVG